MPVAVRAEPLARGGPGFAVWRVAVWLLLLLAAFGCVQYLSHAQLLWTQRQVFAPGAVASAALRGMLAWDIAYLLAAFLLIVLCAGCILRQAWARPALRVAAALLALWMLASGGAMLAQWSAFARASTEALDQLHGDATLQQALLHARYSYLTALVLKAVAVPVLLWLSWRLGVPAVRAQFRHRR
ncbi:hypothetical protein B0E47_07135 [Rhodanobacter sp. B05]|uniref:hypothetical protein n=1 Tax=Rhodanobacter sp. B05 TaxID=1945859 RepID=UPI000984625F|nr:hypothetical protein [Rhodanobacter sp. B05]OOG57091.1 hypothetical protein B0E47_07135 [Rhodanobacter sp. B05]